MEWNLRTDNMREVAGAFWEAVKDRSVIAFHGPMGVGKTTFIHALCDVKGVREGVGSPTFSLVNEYVYDCQGTPKPLFHLDLYRLRDEEEAIRAGLEDVLYSGHICLVEWPEKAPGIFPGDTVHVRIEMTGPESRKVIIGEN